MPTLILKLTCLDRPGIVAAVSGLIAEQDGNILASSQFFDQRTGQFFMRVRFALTKADRFSFRFAPIANRFEMRWDLQQEDVRGRVLIMVSRFDHCLVDLLYRWRTGTIRMDIVGVVSNHEDARPIADQAGVEFHHLPITPETRAAQEAALLRIIEDTRTDLVVLARYMQVLSDSLCNRLFGKVINIHHSFLPSFKGARPYHQAHERGVKLIGATAHYVTSDLDEGPIIEQVVSRVDHAHEPSDLIEIGRSAECLALASAVRWHLEHRVLLNGLKTVVFR